jgi:hypothetical protein
MDSDLLPLRNGVWNWYTVMTKWVLEIYLIQTRCYQIVSWYVFVKIGWKFYQNFIVKICISPSESGFNRRIAFLLAFYSTDVIIHPYNEKIPVFIVVKFWKFFKKIAVNY